MNPAPDDSARDCQLEAILHEYLQAVDAGHPPEHEALLRQHPEFASELTAFFADQDAVAQVAHGMAEPKAAPHAAAEAPTLSPAETSAFSTGVTLRYFGDYELLEEIARGGMGVVYKARQVSLNRLVALKMILAGQLASPGDVQRFRTEAEAAANLDHPHIVPIYEIGEHEGQHYFSMKLIEGGSLAQALSSQPSAISQKDAAKLMATVARAVHYAHQRGILHRDLKPGNILLASGGRKPPDSCLPDGKQESGGLHRTFAECTPFVADFGLAKLVATPGRQPGEHVFTQTGAIVGTPSYMAPEQARGEKALTTAADTYSLGAILYELLAGRPPFQAATPLDTVLQVLEQEPVSLSKIRPQVDRDLETITLKCLEKTPQQRYSSPEALAEELERWLRGEPILARPVSGPGRLWRWCRRNPGIAASLAGLFATLFIGVIVASRFAIVASRNADRADANFDHAARLAALAKENEEQAKANERQAKENEQRAKQNADQIKEEKRLSDRRRYVSEMKLASLEWEAGQTNLVQQRLQQFEPKDDGEDLRGFEWYYLQRQMQLGFRPFPMRDFIQAVAFSPDGSLIACGSTQALVIVLDVVTGRKVHTLRGHDSGVPAVAYSRDGRNIASASHDGTVKLWDALTGREIRSFGGRRDGYVWRSVAFSPDGSRIAAGKDFEIQVWDVTTGQESLTIRAVGRSLAFSPDGRGLVGTQLATGADNPRVKVTIWNAATGQELLAMPGGGSAVAITPDGQRIASGGFDGTVKIWDAATGRETHSLRGQPDGAQQLAFSPDGQRLAGLNGKTIQLWDIAKGQETLTLHGGGDCMAFSPDGRSLASAGRGQVRIWDTIAGQAPLTLARPSFGNGIALAFSPDGRGLISANGSGGVVKLWDAITSEVIATHKCSSPDWTYYSPALSPDGGRFAFAAHDGSIKVGDTSSGKTSVTLKGSSNEVACLAFSPKSRRIASSYHDNEWKITLWDAVTGEKIRILSGHKQWVMAFAFSGDDRRLASASMDGTIKVWDADTGQEIQSYPGGAGALAFSKDGQHLASGHGDGTIKIWDLSTGQTTHVLRGHPRSVRALAYTPDGRRLASASDDGSVKIWDTMIGQETLSLRTPGPGTTEFLAFNPDGRRLASGDIASIQVWDSNPLSEELSIEREARSLVQHLFKKQLSSGEIGQAIQKDQIISEPLRQAALAWAKVYEKGVLADEAERLVEGFFQESPLRAEVVERIKKDHSLGGVLRHKALALAERWLQDYDKLWMSAWNLSWQAGAKSDKYQKAFRYAEAGHQLAPNDGWCLLTLGVAQYRVGHYQEALATLTRSASIKKKALDYIVPAADLPFLAMAQFQLGKEAEARTTLDRLIKDAEHPDLVENADYQAILREAAALLQVKLPGKTTDNARELRRIWWVDQEQDTVAHIGRTVFSPDGKHFLGCGDAGPAGTIRVWDVPAGREVQEFLPGTDAWFSFAVFTPDGKYVLASYTSNGNVLLLWDLATGKVVRRFEGHQGVVMNQAVSPDGKLIVSGSADRTLRLWELETGKELHKLEGHTDNCYGLFSADGKQVLSFGQDKTLRVWDVETGKRVCVMEGHTAPCFGRFSPDGKHIISYSADKTVRLWDAQTGKPVRSFAGPSDELLGAAFLEEGKRVAAWGKDRILHIWKTDTGEELQKLELGEDCNPGNGLADTDLAISLNARRLLTCHKDGTIRLRELDGGKELCRFQNAYSARGVSFSPDGRYAAAGSFRNGLHLWRLPD
jgi:WD40 repeat protein/serine/threonine protein kinase